MTETRRPVVVLCGFMGTGKTAAGAALASLLSVPFVDTDRLIEDAHGRSVADIFASDGEAQFRAHEAEAVKRIASDARLHAGAVIATGGGTVLRDDVRGRLASLGTMVALDASIEAIAERGRFGASAVAARAREEVDLPAMRSSSRGTLLLQPHCLAPRYHRPDARGDCLRDCRSRAARRRVDPRARRHASAFARPGQADPDLAWVVERGALSSLGAGSTGGNRRTGVRAPSRTVAGFTAWPPVTRWIPRASRIVSSKSTTRRTGRISTQAERLLYELTDAGATRDAAVVALGGGHRGSRRLVAAIYMRGVAFVQAPTTLLARVDASIGGKVGINHPRVKNLIGTVHQPHLVLTDPDTLATLPARDLAGGMAEVVKTAIIGSPELFERLRAAAESGAPQNNAALLEDSIRECVRIKGRVVEADPYERDLRRVLNLGHTLGHAIEAASGYAH
jgi:3-dehydroquinate synthetase